MPENLSNATFAPTKKEVETIKYVLNAFDVCKKAREKTYPLLGGRTPKEYWDTQEKRFVAYTPPKDVTDDDWQANITMGLTRNAVLQQISKTGMRVPECRIQDWTKEGFTDSERSRIWQNAYRWSLRRENADWIQQFISLGNYVRGNACIYEGFEDREIEVDIVTDTDFETGEVKTEKQKLKRWGPRRQIVPLDEIYFPNFFKRDLKTQSFVIWARVEDYDSLKAEYQGFKNWKKVKPGIWNVPAINDPFFKPRTLLGKKQVFVMRLYGNPWEGGEDRMCILANGVPLVDDVIPFNHKRPPFAWTLNEPFSDSFMLGCGVPFKMMDQQDAADAGMNMAIDKNTLSMQKPVMTDDPDARIDNFIYPGAVMKFTKGSQWQTAPIEGVQQGEFNFLQMVIGQAKEFSGAFGGAGAASARGGKVTARQAVMMEDEVKRQLALSMTNLEMLERDVCVLRMHNFKQFAPGADQRIEATEAALGNGKKGRFVMFLVKSVKEAIKMESVDHELSQMELAGQESGIPTEAIAVAPEWFDQTDRLEAECVAESTYLRNSTLEQAVADDRMKLMIGLKQVVPSLNVEEIVRSNMDKHGEDTKKFLSAQPPPQPEQGQPGQPPPGGPGITPQIAGNRGLAQIMGTK